VSWRYYVFEGTEPDCQDDAAVTCAPVPQDAKTPGIWNPLPYFSTVRDNGQLGNIISIDNFLQGRRARQPSGGLLDHPDGRGQRAPARARLRRPGVCHEARERDHAQPGLEIDGDLPRLGRLGRLLRPRRSAEVDLHGYGLRVPALVISPYAKRGYIDHQVLSFDAYLKFIEDDFLDGQRLDPMNDGRPDPRPFVRENVAILGDLTESFDFDQKPRAPLILNPYPSSAPK
jgi:hypothetical protein